MSDSYKHLYYKMRDCAIEHNLKADRYEKVAKDLYEALAGEIDGNNDLPIDDPRILALWAYEQLVYPTHP